MGKRAKTRHKRKEPSKIGAYVITGLMIFLMVASIAGVMLYAPGDPNKIEYNGLEFSIDQDLGAYVANVDGSDLFFQYLPSQTLPVTLDYDAINLLKTAQVYAVTFNPKQAPNQLQLYDYTRLSLQMALINVIPGVTAPSSDYQLPVFDCMNSTIDVPVILLRNATETAIKLEGNCIIVEGQDGGLLMAKDALIYAYFDIYTDYDQELMRSYNEE